MWELFQAKGNEKQGKNLFGSLPVEDSLCSVRCLRVHSAQRVDWMSVEAAIPAALGELRAARLPTTVLLCREETTYTRRKDLKLSSSSIFIAEMSTLGQPSA